MSESYRIRSPETWEAARLAYLDGCSADEICGQFDLGLSAFRKRARQEGWRRTDQSDPDPVIDDDDGPALDDRALADLALRRMGVAARRGRVIEALRWARLRDLALRQAMVQHRLDAYSAPVAAAGPPAHAPLPLPAPTPDSQMTPREKANVILARARAELHDVHDIHSNSPFEPGLNRTERRRRLKRMKKQTGPP